MRGTPSGYAVVYDSVTRTKRATNIIFGTRNEARLWIFQTDGSVDYRIVHNEDAPLRAGL